MAGIMDLAHFLMGEPGAGFTLASPARQVRKKLSGPNDPNRTEGWDFLEMIADPLLIGSMAGAGAGLGARYGGKALNKLFGRALRTQITEPERFLGPLKRQLVEELDPTSATQYAARSTRAPVPSDPEKYGDLSREFIQGEKGEWIFPPEVSGRVPRDVQDTIRDPESMVRFLERQGLVDEPVESVAEAEKRRLEKKWGPEDDAGRYYGEAPYLRVGRPEPRPAAPEPKTHVAEPEPTFGMGPKIQQTEFGAGVPMQIGSTSRRQLPINTGVIPSWWARLVRSVTEPMGMQTSDALERMAERAHTGGRGTAMTTAERILDEGIPEHKALLDTLRGEVQQVREAGWSGGQFAQADAGGDLYNVGGRIDPFNLSGSQQTVKALNDPREIADPNELLRLARILEDPNRSTAELQKYLAAATNVRNSAKVTQDQLWNIIENANRKANQYGASTNKLTDVGVQELGELAGAETIPVVKKIKVKGKEVEVGWFDEVVAGRQPLAPGQAAQLEKVGKLRDYVRNSLSTPGTEGRPASEGKTLLSEFRKPTGSEAESFPLVSSLTPKEQAVRNFQLYAEGKRRGPIAQQEAPTEQLFDIKPRVRFEEQIEEHIRDMAAGREGKSLRSKYRRAKPPVNQPSRKTPKLKAVPSKVVLAAVKTGRVPKTAKVEAGLLASAVEKGEIADEQQAVDMLRKLVGLKGADREAQALAMAGGKENLFMLLKSPRGNVVLDALDNPQIRGKKPPSMRHKIRKQFAFLAGEDEKMRDLVFSYIDGDKRKMAVYQVLDDLETNPNKLGDALSEIERAAPQLPLKITKKTNKGDVAAMVAANRSHLAKHLRAAAAEVPRHTAQEEARVESMLAQLLNQKVMESPEIRALFGGKAPQAIRQEDLLTMLDPTALVAPNVGLSANQRTLAGGVPGFGAGFSLELLRKLREQKRERQQLPSM